MTSCVSLSPRREKKEKKKRDMQLHSRNSKLANFSFSFYRVPFFVPFSRAIKKKEKKKSRPAGETDSLDPSSIKTHKMWHRTVFVPRTRSRRASSRMSPSRFFCPFIRRNIRGIHRRDARTSREIIETEKKKKKIRNAKIT